MAANPATNPPIKPVIRINRNDASPKENNAAIFLDKILSFLISIIKASAAHNKKILIKPDRKLNPIFWGITSKTRKEIIAILHHGKYNPAMKAKIIINKIDRRNRIIKFKLLKNSLSILF